jgi:glycosyltransferase involved in cell wall biosynthesis
LAAALKVAYFILNDFEYDSRARLEVEKLAEMGHCIEIIATAGGASNRFHGCRIHRVPQWRGPTRKFRFVQYNVLAAAVSRRLHPDICHAVDLDTLLAAVWGGGRQAVVIYEARELYTELEALGGRKSVKRVWGAVERRLIGRAAAVITINDAIADELRRRYGIERPHVIRNASPLSEELKPVDLRSLLKLPGDCKLLLYQGVLRRGQGLNTIVELMPYLERTALILIGSGPLEKDLKALVERRNLGHKVRFLAKVAPDLLAGYTAGADAGLLLMEDVALNNRLALPQKIFQYLVAGLPQIVAPLPELAKFVSGEKTGIVVLPEKVEEMAHQIRDFLFDVDAYNEARGHCRESAFRNNWENESQKLVEVYRRAVKGPAPDRPEKAG